MSYSIVDILNYTLEDLDKFLSQFPTDPSIYLTLGEKRYMTVYYLHQHNLVDPNDMIYIQNPSFQQEILKDDFNFENFKKTPSLEVTFKDALVRNNNKNFDDEQLVFLRSLFTTPVEYLENSSSLKDDLDFIDDTVLLDKINKITTLSDEDIDKKYQLLAKWIFAQINPNMSYIQIFTYFHPTSRMLSYLGQHPSSSLFDSIIDKNKYHPEALVLLYNVCIDMISNNEKYDNLFEFDIIKDENMREKIKYLISSWEEIFLETKTYNKTSPDYFSFADVFFDIEHIFDEIWANGE